MLQSQIGHFEEEKNYLPLPGFELRAIQPVAYSLYRLSRKKILYPLKHKLVLENIRSLRNCLRFHMPFRSVHALSFQARSQNCEAYLSVCPFAWDNSAPTG